MLVSTGRPFCAPVSLEIVIILASVLHFDGRRPHMSSSGLFHVILAYSLRIAEDRRKSRGKSIASTIAFLPISTV